MKPSHMCLFLLPPVQRSEEHGWEPWLWLEQAPLFPSVECESEPSVQVPQILSHWPICIWYGYFLSIIALSLLFPTCFPVSLKGLNMFGLIFWSCPLTFSALFTITPILSRNYFKWVPAIHIWCKFFFPLDGINQSQSGSALLKHLRTKTFQLNARKVDSWLSIPIVGWT